MAEAPRRIYWDSCAWIGLVNSEPDKIHPLRSIWEAAQRGKYEIWTSTYVYLEVIKGRAAHGQPYPPEESDRIIEEVLSQPYVRRVQMDVQIGRLARSLRRLHNEHGLKHRPDAIHLATAVAHNVDELHTWDRSHLLVLDGKVRRRDGVNLPIFIPGAEVMESPLFAAMAASDGKTVEVSDESQPQA